MSKHTRFVGLDPSLTGTGLAMVDLGAHPLYTVTHLSSTGSREDSLLDRHERLSSLLDRVLDWVDWREIFVVIEGPAFAQSNAGTWDRAGLWWMFSSSLLEAGVQVVELPPTKLKKFATGRGNATKPDMRMALFQRLGLDLRNDNEVDALFLALAGAWMHGHNPAELPKSLTSCIEVMSEQGSSE